MEMDGRELVREVTRKNSSEPTIGTTATLSRWSSEPASLSSAGDDPAGTDLLERTRRSIATLQRTLAAERDRSRRLEVQLQSERARTTLTPTTFDAILRCIEQERCENRQLHSTVLRQHKTIAKLRRQLRALKLRPTTDGCSSISSDDLDDGDDSISDFEMVFVHPDCGNCTADNSHRMVIRSQSENTVSTVSRTCLGHSQPSDRSAPRSTVTAAVGGPRCCDADRRATGDRVDDDTETLRRRLRDTVETCQRLATALDAKRGNLATQDVSQTTSSNHSVHTAQLLANVDKITQSALNVEKTSGSTVDLLTTYKAQLSAAAARLKEVEEMNARWQGYVEQREKYTHALEQRCSDLEQAANQHHHQQHPHPHPQHQQQQLTEEQQRRVDQILLDQRQKTELAVEARLQTEAENKQLRAKLKQMTTTRDQNKVCIDQLLSRLREMEAARRSEQSTADALRQQVNAYREDFEGERLDRHRAQERVVNLERQVAALKHRLGAYESSWSRSTTQRCWQESVGEDGSLAPLVAHGRPSSVAGDISPPRPSLPDRSPKSY